LNEESQIEGLGESAKFLGRLVEGEVEMLLQAGDDAGKAGKLGGEEEKRVMREDARKRIVVGGFSQGAAMGVIALLSGMLGGHEGGRIGGFVGLSGWCPFRKQILDAVAKTDTQEHPEARKFISAMQYLRNLLGLKEISEGDTVGVQPTPVFVGHGERDMKMKVQWGRDMGEVLEEMVFHVIFKEYEGLEHWWNLKEMEDLVGFLRGDEVGTK
jgi:predicted esterase